MSLQARAPQPKADEPVGEVKAKEVVLGAEGAAVRPHLRAHRGPQSSSCGAAGAHQHQRDGPR